MGVFPEKLILVVDDSEDDASLLKLLFKKARIQNPVFVLENGSQAISYLGGFGEYADRTKSPLPSVMFLDLRMPGVDGYDVLNWVRQQPGLTPILVIALSAMERVQDISRAYQSGANSFLSKPCQLEDLANLQKVFPGFWMVPQPAFPERPSASSP